MSGSIKMDNLQNKKRVAVVGYGGQGKWHVQKLLTSDVAEVAGIWDIREERRQLAKEDGIYVYDSLDAVLADKSVDIVTIATYNESHMDIAIAAMEAGKHVVCEKPVTVDSESLQKMFDASVRTGKVFAAHQNRRWDSDFVIMKELYASGELGRVFGIESRYQGSRGIPGDWRSHKEHGGGMMLDWGVHLIDQMVNLVYDRKLEKVYCRCDHITNDEVDDGFRMDMYFEGGLTARVEVGTSHFITMPRYYMTGTDGAAMIATWHSDCRVVYCKQREEKDVTPVITGAGLTKTMAPRDSKTTTEREIARPVTDVHEYYRNFCRVIDGKEEQIVTHAQMMKVMKIMEACFRSDELGVPVDVE